MTQFIKFQDNNHIETHREKWTDLEWLGEFYNFLQGEDVPKEIFLKKSHIPKMSKKKAMSIIWYLQEHLRILPDYIEQCSVCGSLYNSWSEGIYWETKGKFFCGACDYLVPENYDKGKR